MTLLALLGGSVFAQSGTARNNGMYPTGAKPFGQSYSEWSGAYWQWFLEHPVEDHPGINSGTFDVTSGQSGNVWFLATPLEQVTRVCTIPDDKALYVGTLCSEWSSLEGYPTEQEQRDTARDFGNHIVGMTGSLDGRPLVSLDSYRFESPQVEFTAPTPWIFGDVGGTGTMVADGYYFFLKPLTVGTHVLHYSGMFHFSEDEGDPFTADFGADITYVLNVVPH